METVSGLFIVIIIAYLSSRFSPVLLKLPIGAQYILFTGTEYLFLGVILGPIFIGLLSKDVLTQLKPLVSLGLGWIGLLYGIQFSWKDIRRFPLIYLFIAFSQGLVTMAVVTTAFYPLLTLWDVYATGETYFYPLLFTLAVSASLTSPSAIATLHRRFKLEARRNPAPEGQVKHEQYNDKIPLVERETVKLLRYISSIDSMPALLLFGGITAFFHVTGIEGAGFSGWKWFLINIGAGFILAFLFNLLLTARYTASEFLTITIGMVILSSGIASYLYLSPLFMNMVVGIILANTSAKKDAIYETLINTERAFYIIFVILVGALWSIEPLWGLVGALIYTGTRIAGKYLGGIYSIKLFKPSFSVPKDLGLGLLPQGGVAIAIAISLTFIYKGILTDRIVSVILFGVILNEIIGPFYLLRILKGEEKEDG